MSAYGYERTYLVLTPMSAFGGIADAASDTADVSYRLIPDIVNALGKRPRSLATPLSRNSVRSSTSFVVERPLCYRFWQPERHILQISVEALDEGDELD